MDKQEYLDNTVTIYCDGGCRGNGKEANLGAWASYIEWRGRVKEIYEAVENTTNNKMELTGVIKALECLVVQKYPVRVYCDSAYVVNGINDWVAGWKKRGWKKADKKPILNLELWKELDRLVGTFDDIQILKVKGHADNVGNNRADELVNIAMDEAESNT